MDQTQTKPFVGCYSSRRTIVGSYDKTEIGLLKVTSENDKKLVFSSCGKTIFPNGNIIDEGKFKTEFNFSGDSDVNGKCVRLGQNKFVCESKSESLFGQPENNAQVFTIKNDHLTRQVYLNYDWKSPWGTYWFSEECEKHTWKRTNSEECAHL